jgi:hypothetical protein
VNRSRDNNRGVAYEQYLIDRAAEVAEEQRQRDAAQAAAVAADPVLSFQKASNQLAEEMRTTIQTTRLGQDVLPGERINGRKINEDVAISNFKLFATTQPGFKKDIHGRQLLDMMEFQDLAPLVENYKALFALMTEYALFVEPEQEAPQQETRYTDAQLVDPVSLLTPSEQAVYKHQQYCEKIIGHDESGRGWTMQQVDALPSKEMLRLLRLFEQGHRGSNLLTVYREIQDIKQHQEAERDRIAAEEMEER